MKKLHRLFLVTVLFSFFGFASCKGKDSNKSEPAVTTTDSPSTTEVAPPSAPVVVATDDALKSGLTDALKNYPTLKGNVSDSIIHLSGTVKRSDWQKLMPTLNSLHPKRIKSDSVTIK